MSQVRTIKKYPNRRMYDTAESRYITLADVRQLVIDELPFTVLDQKSGDDITRSILLQVISEQEACGEPLLTPEFLCEMIRAYGRDVPGFVGAYLEQSLALFLRQQQELRTRVCELEADPDAPVRELAHQNWTRWVSLQQDVLNAMMGVQPRPGGARNKRDSGGRPTARPGNGHPAKR